MESTEFETLNQLFLDALKKHSWPSAFLRKTEGRYQGISSERAVEMTAALAAALSRREISRGDRVAILGENRLEWALTDYAAMGLRAVVVPIYPTLLESDVEFILRDSEARVIVLSTAAQLTKVLTVRNRLPELERIIIMDEGPSNSEEVESWHQIVEHELKNGSDLVARFERTALQAKADDTATIVYTSGTTGQAKGVLLTHWNISSNVQASLKVFPLSHKDVAISFLPLSHIFERMLDYAYLSRGVSIAYAESLDTLPKNLLEVRPTIVAVVPRVLEKILEKVMEKVRQAPGSRQRLFHWAIEIGKQYSGYTLDGRTAPAALRAKHALADALVFKKIRAGVGGRLEMIISGAAPLSREVANFFHAFGLPVYEGYGLTETSPVIAVNYPGAVKLGTVGHVIPGVEVRLGDEFTDAGGVAGREVLVRGPNVTAGYYRPGGEDQEAFRDGWFYTGDLGTMDSEGFLSVTGRRKNLFKTSGGKYIAPEKVENVFQGHPYVAQMVVFGDGRHFVSALIVPDFTRLERYAHECGIPFRTREELVSDPRIQEFMQEQVDQATAQLPKYERIHQIGLLANEFTIASAELSPTQKIKRRVVEENYRELIEEIYRRKAPKQQSGIAL
jgi:long-chain acyl-CoA synthetase